MKFKTPNPKAERFALAASPKKERPVRDTSGYTIFSDGEAGAVHVMAHRALDEQRFEAGHRLLGKWLAEHTGLGSEWVHLQFHMAVFDLALENWDAAYNRFLDEILPVAATTEDALTDAPALLWRLALTAGDPVALPWEALRRTALAHMQRPADPFVELHDLLALAGAGDVANIERWLDRSQPAETAIRKCLAYRMAQALLAYATRAYEHAAIIMARVAPLLPQVGGSRAQNELFSKMQQASWRQASKSDFSPPYAKAA